jgi:hypothetical protein
MSDKDQIVETLAFGNMVFEAVSWEHGYLGFFDSREQALQALKESK